MQTATENPIIKRHSTRVAGKRAVWIAAGALALTVGPVFANGDDDEDDHYGKNGICSKTAKLALQACRAEARDDLLIARANCINLSDRGKKRDCKQTARQEDSDFRALCKEQFDARLDVCDLIGEEPYDPGFDPSKFVVGGNEYFPLSLGACRT